VVEGLNGILQGHTLWLNGESQGKRADLRGADLRWAGIIQLSFSRWMMTVTTTNIFIGCERVQNDERAAERLAALAEKYDAEDLLPAYLSALEFAKGIFENQADDVLVRVQADEAHEAMLDRWGEPADNYPEQLYLVLWIAVKDVALAWIDENCPRAWFRPMFEST